MLAYTNGIVYKLMQIPHMLESKVVNLCRSKKQIAPETNHATECQPLCRRLLDVFIMPSLCRCFRCSVICKGNVRIINQT